MQTLPDPPEFFLLTRTLDGLDAVSVGVRVPVDTVDTFDAVDTVCLDLLGHLLSLGDWGLVGISLRVGTEIAGIDVGLFTLAGTVSLLDKLLVGSQDRLELGNLDIVEEDAFTKVSIGDGETLLAITGLLDGFGSDGNKLLVERWVIDGKSDRGDELEPLVSLGIVEDASGVGEGDRVGHVDHDGVTVSQGDTGSELQGG